MSRSVQTTRQPALYALLLLVGCAKQASPTGGDRDTQAPVLIASSIPPSSTNVFPKKITFFFDENIQLKNPETNITISPIISPPPRFLKSNKSVTILLNSDSLSGNTTYAISFNNSISDLNEGNAFPRSVFLFGTGNTIDSQSIRGEIIYAEKPKKDALKLWCIPENISLHFTAKIDSQKFHVSGLNSTTKNITVFNDENNNSLPDPLEDIGFLKNISPGNDMQKVHMYSRKKTTVNTTFSNNNYYITGVPTTKSHQLQSKYPSLYSIQDTLFADTSLVKQIKEALNPNYFILSGLIESKPNYLSYRSYHNIYDSIPNTVLAFNQNIRSIQPNSISFSAKTTDSIASPTEIKILGNTLYLHAATSGSFVLPPGSVEFGNGSNNKDTIKVSHVPVNSVITLQNTFDTRIKGFFTIEKKEFAFTLSPGAGISVHVPQGTHKIFYFLDTDNNDLLTAPNPDALVEGEIWRQVNTITADPKMANELILK